MERFPNFDHRLDEPDPGPQEDRDYIQWRDGVIAAAKVCPAFVQHARITDWCTSCNGPRRFHSASALLLPQKGTAA